jgi:peptidoglycan hydrolase-like protein with peptidoglycan-binding domain
MQTFALKTRAAATRSGRTHAIRRAPEVRQILRAPQVQTKLKIGAVDDPAEREADRVADQVMRMPARDFAGVVNPPPASPGATIAAPVISPRVQRACPACEQEMQRKEGDGAGREGGSASPATEARVAALGTGAPLPASERAFFEPRFNRSFDDVRVHTGARADGAAKSVQARAFTVGNDIAFSSDEYRPGTAESRTLLAHELTHVAQQGSASRLQRAWISDTGWRYTPPTTVTRSILEIQAVVGVTPDGTYGPNTREAVKRYQTKLHARGLYSGTIDGKWGDATELAHVANSTGNESEDYNCSGLAFKTLTFLDMADTDAILAGMTPLSDCTAACNPRQYKFWLWKYDVSLTDMVTGITGPANQDFHIVGGQTDGSGRGPATVVSKNGHRPVQPPAPPASWFPMTEMARSNDHHNTPSTQFRKNRANHVQTCFCADHLP